MIIEEIIQDYLSKKISCPVLFERPEKAKAPYVLIEKTGSGKAEHICSSTVALQSYADSLLQAMILNEQVKEAMDTLACIDEVCRSQLNSDYNFTDPTTRQYRYQAVYDIIHY